MSGLGGLTGVLLPDSGWERACWFGVMLREAGDSGREPGLDPDRDSGREPISGLAARFLQPTTSGPAASILPASSGIGGGDCDGGGRGGWSKEGVNDVAIGVAVAAAAAAAKAGWLEKRSNLSSTGVCVAVGGKAGSRSKSRDVSFLLL